MVITAGPRRRAYEWFCQALRAHPTDTVLLLVDSEEPLVEGDTRWGHVARREGDRWAQPDGVTEEHLHFMVIGMETWLIADPAALKDYFGEGFVERHLPGTPDLELLDKRRVNSALEQATRQSRRRSYEKGRDFKLLGRISPAAVQARCPQARIFVGTLRSLLAAPC